MNIVISEKTFEEMKELPDVVYKYRFWNDNYHKEIIYEQIVFMAKPSSFEDKLDCKLQKRYDLMSNQDIYNP